MVGVPKADVDHLVHPRDRQKPECQVTQAISLKLPFLGRATPALGAASWSPVECAVQTC